MGTVFAAENTVTGKRVAIKCMHPEIIQSAEASNRFLREARASARIQHPNVVDVYDVLSEGDRLFLVMEYLDGEPLAALLDREPIPLPSFARIMLGAMRGVRAAHRERVIHRDIKPENIFLARESEDELSVPKVLDFGISKVQDSQEIALTTPGAALGTVLYMAKEQLLGVGDIDARADVYAFGVIAYLAVTGRFPFYAETLTALVLSIMTTDAAPVAQLRPDVPPALAETIERAMAKEREDRFASLEVLMEAFEEFTDDRRYRRWFTRRTHEATLRTHASQVENEQLDDAGLAPTAAPEPEVSTETPFSTSSVMRAVAAHSRGYRYTLALSALAVITAFGWWLLTDRVGNTSASLQTDPPLHASSAQDLPNSDRVVQSSPEYGAPEARTLAREPTPAEAPGSANVSRASTRAESVRPVAAAPVPASPSASQTAVAAAAKQPANAAIAPNSAVPSGSSINVRGANVAEARARAAAQLSYRPKGASAPVAPPSPTPAPAMPSSSPMESQSASKSDCKPNYYLDQQGEKHFKPQCF